MYREIKRTDKLVGKERAYVAFRGEHVAFNTQFAALAGLKAGKRVKYFVDEANYRVAMKFFENDETENTYAITFSGKNAYSGYGELKNLSWVNAIQKLPTHQRRFEPRLVTTEFGKLWEVSVCPSFELKRARESDKIAADEVGIYRYKRDGEVVYIGRGNVKERLRSPGRNEWEFDVVEYSRVENPDDQAKWEDYWLEQYRAENDGRLPLYNKIRAAASKTNRQTD